MDSAATLMLFTLLIAFVGDAAASCRKVANEDMLEYFCEDSHPADLMTVPETTEKLRIIRMPLRRITADTFARFGGNLWVLSCSHCEITDIDADAFRRLVNLQQLSLDSNRLTTIKASWFEGLDYLTYLDFNYNDIHDIEDGVYKNLPNLVDLRISGNRLRCLNLDEMSHLKELKRMFLSENSDFACPHAVSKFLTNQGVVFDQDPEWKRLATDTIDVRVPPPSYVKEDEETMPVHRENLHPDRKPPLEESGHFPRDMYPFHPDNRAAHPDRKPPLEESGHFSRDMYPFHPDNRAAHRSRHRKPTTTTVRPTTPKQEEFPLPRVEPRFPDTRPSHIPESSHQVLNYPYSTLETLRAPSSEDIKTSDGIDEPSRTEHNLMYETTPHWSYSTQDRSVTSIPLSEGIRITETDRPSQMEGTPPPYIPTREFYPSYPISERSQVIGSSENEMIEESRRQSEEGNTVTYPLYVATSDGVERTPHGSIQVTHPSSSNSDMVTFGTTWSTDSIEHPSLQARYGQSRHPAEENDKMTSTKTPYYGHDPRKMIVEESSSETDDVTDLEAESQSTTTSVHYIRPSPPELIHSPSTDQFYQAPYYESAVTVHPRLRNYKKENDPIPSVLPLETTTTPLPDCPDNSAMKTRPTAALVTFIVVTVFGHAVVQRFYFSL